MNINLRHSLQIRCFLAQRRAYALLGTIVSRSVCVRNGTPGRIRTCDLLLRSSAYHLSDICRRCVLAFSCTDGSDSEPLFDSAAYFGTNQHMSRVTSQSTSQRRAEPESDLCLT